MSSDKHNSKKADKKADKASAEEYQIKPAKGGPSMDTANWPLLLKVCCQQFILPLYGTHLLSFEAKLRKVG